MQVPQVKLNDQIDARVTLDPNSLPNKIFKLGSDNFVRIDPRVQSIFSEGKICPPDGNYEVTFVLESDIAGRSQRIGVVQIASNIPEELRYSITQSADSADEWAPPGE